MPQHFPPPARVIRSILETALAEDLGASGDITTQLLVPPDLGCRARLISRVPGVLSGGVLLQPLFSALDPAVQVTLCLEDGGQLEAGACIALIEGPAAAVLTGERVALNLTARLSGIATLTRAYVERAGTGARVADTRKTTPGLRALERYAVRCGGAFNHRFSLADGILIKDNHLAICGGLAEAVRRARARAPHPMRVEVEVETVEQAREACAAGADILLLDNMSCEQMRLAASELGTRAILEASGGINLKTVAEVAATGVHYLSVGALTHGAKSLDLSLEMEAAKP